MDRWILKGCLEQLLKVYVYAEQQYVHAAIESLSPALHNFFRQRAFERSDFILKLQREIDFLKSNCSPQKSIEAFYEWHDYHYAKSNLKDWPITDINLLIIDEKAWEICNCLLNDPLPATVYQLIAHQTLQIESSLLSYA
ncbi:ferritin family protein [Costertonia aggregata]|uniref:DUF2383 domain-containing protein n=1 Tax=Costertonia aggregata TaxID=343403 RepID=A0A7H9ASR8_9FLAO|nr:hypothetical protein [Costertonia aggregata]QLG46513.1 hypothetical protein HYG79_14540 [Costertonia aggregata]